MSSAQVIVRENFRKTRGNLGGMDHLPEKNGECVRRIGLDFKNIFGGQPRLIVSP